MMPAAYGVRRSPYLDRSNQSRRPPLSSGMEVFQRTSRMAVSGGAGILRSESPSILMRLLPGKGSVRRGSISVGVAISRWMLRTNSFPLNPATLTIFMRIFEPKESAQKVEYAFFLAIRIIRMR